MHSSDSQFSKKHHKKKRHLVIGGVVIPTWPGYWTSIGGVNGFGGGDMSTGRDVDMDGHDGLDGDASSAATGGGADAGGASVGQ